MMRRVASASVLFAAVAVLGLEACANDSRKDEFKPEKLTFAKAGQPMVISCPPPDVASPGDALMRIPHPDPVKAAAGETLLVPPYIDDQTSAGEAGGSIPISSKWPVADPLVLPWGNGGLASGGLVIYNDKTARKPNGGKKTLPLLFADGTPSTDQFCPDTHPYEGGFNYDPAAPVERAFWYLRNISETTKVENDRCVGLCIGTCNGAPTAPAGERCLAVDDINTPGNESLPFSLERSQTTMAPLLGVCNGDCKYEHEPETCFGAAIQVPLGSGGPFDASCARDMSKPPGPDGKYPCAKNAAGAEQKIRGITFLAVARQRTKIRLDFGTMQSDAKAKPLPGLSKEGAWCRDYPPSTPSCELEAFFNSPDPRVRADTIRLAQADEAGAKVGQLGGACDPDPAQPACAEGYKCSEGRICVTDHCTGDDKIPACGKTCSVDSDCGAGTYCDGATKACVADCIKDGNDGCGLGRKCNDSGRCYFDAATCAKKRLNEFQGNLASTEMGVCPRPFWDADQSTVLDQSFRDLFNVTQGCDDHPHAVTTFEPKWTRHRVYFSALTQRGFGRDINCYPIAVNACDDPDGEGPAKARADCGAACTDDKDCGSDGVLTCDTGTSKCASKVKETQYQCGFDGSMLNTLTVLVTPGQKDYEVYMSDVRFF